MKKTLSLILALALSLALTVPVSATNPITISEENVTVYLSDVISYEDIKVCFPDLEGDDPDTYYLYCNDIRIYHLPSAGVKATLFNGREDPTAELDLVYEGCLLDPDYMALAFLDDDDEELTEVRVPYPALVPLAQIDGMDEDDYIYGQVNQNPVCKGELFGEVPLKVPSDLGKFVALSVNSSEDGEFGGGTLSVLTIYCAFDDGKFSYKDNAVVTIPNAPSQPTDPDAPAYQVSNWAKDRVALAVEAGLAPEGLGNDYRVGITRAQFAAVTVKLYEAMSGQKAPAASENPFTDTEEPVILQAADLGFVSGVGGGKFDPDAPVNREQAAVMLASVYTKLGGGIPAVDATAFGDDGDISGWARNAVDFMNSKEIVTGIGDNNFGPKGGASIEQALLISLKMFETLK